jgi:glycosyltransferase involved in cell wall biosynthesis
MKICLIGKYPPIQGGVSARTYLYAHALAARGHEVHVVTNADEARAPYRVFMRAADWALCEAAYPATNGAEAGSVKVHWSEPFGRRQMHIPGASPYVTKLATLAIDAARASGAEAVFSYYAEPYAVAGHLAAEALGLPHVVRTAGSDAGRLWDHEQFKSLYDHVFRSAAAVMASGVVYRKMRAIGVPPSRLMAGPESTVPTELFTPDGPALDVGELLDQVRDDGNEAFRELVWGGMPADALCIGVYGKLGEKKGTFALLAALRRLHDEGRPFGLLVMGHGRPRDRQDFRAAVEDLGLTGRVLQIPFLPHWRVPEFLRRCAAVCCLEQDFPIAFHGPIIPREVLASGACLVAATEILLKTPNADRLIDGYNCIAVRDVNDTDDLSERLATVLDDPAGAAVLGRRGRRFILDLQKDSTFPRQLETTLLQAISVHRAPDDRQPSISTPVATLAANGHPPSFTRLAIEALTPDERRSFLTAPPPEVADPTLARLVQSLRLDMLDAVDGDDEPPTAELMLTGMFRLNELGGSPLSETVLERLIPIRSPGVNIVEFPFDVQAARQGQFAGKHSVDATSGSSFVAIKENDPRGPRILDRLTAAALALCDGKIDLAEIAQRIPEAEHDGVTPEDIRQRLLSLFEVGLVDFVAGHDPD